MIENIFDIDQKTYGSRNIQINEANKKFQRHKREYESIENDSDDEVTLKPGDQSKSKSKSVRHSNAKR